MSDVSPSSARIRPVILSGGAGTRLWPLSTAERPKQFLPLVGETSLLAQTFARIDDPILFSSPVVVCGARHLDQVRATAAESGIHELRLVAEPVPRNTAAAVALAVLTAADDDELLLILPSDHHIAHPEAFRATVDAARAGAEAGLIVTFGMKPTRIETGFGYVESGAPIAGPVRRALRFVEKPDAPSARKMIESGHFLWNGGIFLATAATFRTGFVAHCPDVLLGVAAAIGDPGASEVFPDPAAFEKVRSLAFDHAVMERFKSVGVIPSDFGWSDVGSWTTAWELSAKDAAANGVTDADAVLVDAEGCYVRARSGKIVALIGVKDLIVVDTEDALLVMPRERAQDVKLAVEQLAARKPPRGV